MDYMYPFHHRTALIVPALLQYAKMADQFMIFLKD